MGKTRMGKIGATGEKQTELVDPFAMAAAIHARDPSLPEEDDSIADARHEDPAGARARMRAAGRERYDTRRTGELDELVPDRRCPLCRRRRNKSGQWVVFDVPEPAAGAELQDWLRRHARETEAAGCLRAAVCRSCRRCDPRARP